jgi:hypothetical protein
MNSVYLCGLGRLPDRLQERPQTSSTQQSNFYTRTARELVPLQALGPCQTALLTLASGESQDGRWLDDGQAGRHGYVDAHTTDGRARSLA